MSRRKERRKVKRLEGKQDEKMSKRRENEKKK